MSQKIKVTGHPLYVASSLILLWLIASASISQPSLVLPTPAETLLATLKLVFDTQILVDIIYTMYRSGIAFFLALVFGIPVGLLLGLHKTLSHSFLFIFDFFRTLPSVVLLPLFLLIFGLNDFARVGLASFTGFWIIGLSIIYGFSHRPQSKIVHARIMNASKLKIFRDVVFFESLPSIFAGAKLAFPVILIIVITAEMLASPTFGIGVRLIDLQSRYKTPEVYGATILIGGIGYTASRLLTYLEHKIIHWKSI